MSNKISFAKKTINTLSVTFMIIVKLNKQWKTKTKTYVNSYDGQTKLMYFLTEDESLLEKYYIWDKIRSDIKKEFDSEAVCNRKLLKTKIRFYSDKATDFHDKDNPKAGSYYTCLAVISVNSALKKDENYYVQAFLKECKYIEKEVIRHITEFFSSGSDEEYLIGQNFVEQNYSSPGKYFVTFQRRKFSPAI